MRRILTIASLLLVSAAHSQTSIVPVGSPTQITEERGGQSAVHLLATPIKEPYDSVYSSFRKKGRLITTSDGHLYHNNGTVYLYCIREDDSTVKYVTPAQFATLNASVSGKKDANDSTHATKGYVTHYQNDTAKNNIRASIAAKQDALGYTPVPTTRTLTINGTAQDLSTNRNWTINAGSDAKYLGSIYNANTWSNLNDFTQNGTSATIASNKISLSGGNNTLSRSLDYNYYTCLDKFSQFARFKVESKSSTSYGFGIGTRSYGVSVKYSMFCKFNMTDDATQGGKLYLYMVGVTNNPMDSSAQVSFSVNDYIEISLVNNFTGVTIYARNATTNSAWVKVKFNFRLYSPYRYNTGRFAVYDFGGSYTLDSISISSNEIKNADILVIGDSKSGVFDDPDISTFNKNWAVMLQKAYPNTVINAGGGDRTTHWVYKIPEILALNPKQIIIGGGAWNNFRNGAVSLSQTLADYDTFCNNMNRAGIEVYHALWFYDTTTNQTDLVTHIYATYDSAHIIDTYTPTKRCGAACLGYNGIHLNDSGNAVVYNTIIESGKLKGASKVLDRVIRMEDTTVVVPSQYGIDTFRNNVYSQLASVPSSGLYGIAKTPNGRWIGIIDSFTTAYTTKNLYGCPLGKRCGVGVINIMNNTGTPDSFYYYVKVGSTINRLTSWTTVSGNFTLNVGFIMEGGDTLGMYATRGSTAVTPVIYQWDTAGSNLKTVRIFGMSTGQNTVYTCPAGKVAYLTPNVYGIPAPSTGQAINNAISIFFGVSTSANVYVVPQGQSATTNTLLWPTGVIGANVRHNISNNGVLPSGASVIYNVTSGDPTIHGWVNVIEN